MEETISGASIPLIFFNGGQETVVGSVFVFPGMDFKSFQTITSQKIGISPHQFSVYLAGLQNPLTSRRRIPITNKSDFSAISREKSSAFLVVLKRSRCERRRPQPVIVPLGRPDPPDNVTILRRESDNAASGYGFPGHWCPIQEWERRTQNLATEKNRYLTTMGMGDVDLAGSGGGDHTLGRRVGADEAACERCAGGETEFHPCVKDPAVFGFRISPYGPIARPVT